MADLPTFNFWVDLENRFLKLQPRPPEYTGDLYAMWNSEPWNEAGEHWYLSGPEDVQVKFRWLAERAVRKLGGPSGDLALSFWLDLLKRDIPRYKHRFHRIDTDGGITTTHESGGVIEYVCIASAEYCLRCEDLLAIQDAKAKPSSSAKVSLPKLPELAERKMALELEELLSQCNLTGEHLSWHQEERDRLVRVRAQNPDGSGGAASENEADGAGIPASINFVSARFEGLLRTYWPYWIARTPLESETMIVWLEVWREVAIAEVKEVWVKGTAWHQAWFERACEPALRKKLDMLVRDSSSNARQLEIDWLDRQIVRPSKLGDSVVVPGQDPPSEANGKPLVEGSAPKKRGRKPTFSEEQLAQAHALKAAGKPNQQVAKALYGGVPTAEQRRSVSTILKHHAAKKKREEI